ncbi:MAG TPA: Mur ligase domain-containing protein [Candidatus Paceibacterota bacterium]
MQYKKAHFIGIGGVGMSATAKLLRDAGATITGSDEEVYPPISTLLEEEGIAYSTPYRASNIPADCGLIVIGKNAKLVPESNEEVAAAFASGKKIVSFPEVLAELSKDKETVVVAGSYGKSTSTALLAHCLEVAGLEPSYFIGAVPLSPNVNAKAGSGNLFILEGDEYPASNTDPRSKFLHYHPAQVLLTPLAHDHFNIFPTPADYLKPFYGLAALASSKGAFIVCVDGPLSKEFLANVPRPVTTYGLTQGDFHAANIAYGEMTTFTLMGKNIDPVHLSTTQLGTHTVQNIVGVGALLLSQQLVTPEQFASAVKSFKGIKRRLDKKSEKTSIPIFEGFGSSYEKLQSAIAAMKLHFPGRRLLVVFEPNTIGWRARATLAQYDHVFTGVAKVFIFNPPHDGKETQLSAEEIAAHVGAHGTPAVAVDTPEHILALFGTELGENDAILLSSSGAMGGLVDSIPKLAEQKFPC